MARVSDLAADTPNALAIGPFGSDLKTSDFVNDGVPVVFVRNVRPNCFRSQDQRYVSHDKAEQLAAHKVRPGDLVVTKMGLPPCVTTIYPDDSPEGIVTADIIKLTPDINRVDARFLSYYLNSTPAKAQVGAFTFGVTRPKVTLSAFRSLAIPIPFPDDPKRSIAEQKRIADILDKADAIRRKREEACKFGDTYLKSTFLAMFGDPATNPRKLPLRRLSDFYVNPKDGTKCGPFGGALKKDEYILSGVPVWQMDNISDKGRLVPEIRLWISDEKYDELSAYAVQDGDVLISRAGTVGKMCVVRAGLKKSLISTNLIRLRLNSSLLPEFFVSLMVYCKGRVGRLKAGPDGSFTHMSTGVLDTLGFPAPSLKEQMAYVDIMDKVNDATAHTQDALSETESLFNSLVQRAFRGDF